MICGFHAGLIEGLLERIPAAAAVEALGHRDPNGCAYRIRRKEKGELAPEQVAGLTVL